MKGSPIDETPSPSMAILVQDAGAPLGSFATLNFDGATLSISGSTVTIQISGSGGITNGDKGDITVSSGGAVWTIDSGAVTYSKIQNVSATDKLLGRSSVGAGNIEEIACTAAGRALIDDADASAQRTTLGLGTLATQSSVNDGNWSGTDLAVLNGGTGASNASSARTNLGLAIGSDIQAFSSILASVASQSFASNGLKVLRVKSDESGFELAAPASGLNNYDVRKRILYYDS